VAIVQKRMFQVNAVASVLRQTVSVCFIQSCDETKIFTFSAEKCFVMLTK